MVRPLIDRSDNMVLLYSGGLDSYIAWEWLKRPKTFYCAIGHRYQDFELAAIQETIPLTVVDHSFNLGSWEEPDANVPMRNALLCMAAAHANSHLNPLDIILVVQRGEMTIPDRTETFCNSIGALLTNLNERMIWVTSPFFHLTKTQMVEWYVQSGFPVEALLKTRSCFNGDEKKPCGACGACFRRWVSLTNNGIKEEHVNDITKWSGIKTYIRKMQAGEYDELRTKETMEALKLHHLI